MPRYYAADIDIRLVATDITASTTALPIHKYGQVLQDRLDQVQQVFKEGQPLAEVDIPCLGEASHVHFLAGAPFLFVQARPGDLSSTRGTYPGNAATDINLVQDERVGISLDKHAPSQGSGSPLTSLASTPSHLSPASSFHTRDDSSNTGHAVVVPGSGNLTTPSLQALHKALHLCISYSSETVLRGPAPVLLGGMKFEVYFNGDLAACSYLPARSLTQNRYHETVFSGRRVGRLLERAWLLSLNATDGGVANGSDPLQRWKDINQSLLNLANASGRNTQGVRAPADEYLEELARLEMPACLAQDQSASRKAYGVMDVVVTLGEGRRDETRSGYSVVPTKPRSSNAIAVGQADTVFEERLPSIPPDPVISAKAESEIDKSRAKGPTSVDLSSSHVEKFEELEQDITSSLSKHEITSNPVQTPSVAPPSLGRVALTPFCDIGSPISLPLPSATENDDGLADLSTEASLLPSSPSPELGTNRPRSISFSLGRQKPFLEHNFDQPIPFRLSNLGASSSPLKSPRRPSQPSPLTLQQRVARSPLSPKHSDILSALRTVPCTAHIDLSEVTQDLLDKGVKITLPESLESQSKSVPPMSLASSNIGTKVEGVAEPHTSTERPWKQKMHSAINHDLRTLGVVTSPVKWKPKSAASPSSATRKLEKFRLIVPKKPDTAGTTDQKQTSKSNQIASTETLQQNHGSPTPSPHISLKHEYQVPCERTSTKRKRFADTDIVEQTLLSLENSSRSVRPRPRPSYEGMDHCPQAVAGAQEGETGTSGSSFVSGQQAQSTEPTLPSRNKMKKASTPVRKAAKIGTDGSSLVQSSTGQTPINTGTTKIKFKMSSLQTPSRASTSTEDLMQHHTGPLNPSRATSQSPLAARNRRSQAAALQPFPMPDLSQDCVLTYAEEGQQRDDGSGDYGVRQIRAERGGWFTESEVLLGVRFLLTADGMNDMV